MREFIDNLTVARKSILPLILMALVSIGLSFYQKRLKTLMLAKVYADVEEEGFRRIEAGDRARRSLGFAGTSSDECQSGRAEGRASIAEAHSRLYPISENLLATIP